MLLDIVSDTIKINTVSVNSCSSLLNITNLKKLRKHKLIGKTTKYCFIKLLYYSRLPV